jgi:ADP-ribosyl-[dinitrogen reductase] hydrolase
LENDKTSKTDPLRISWLTPSVGLTIGPGKKCPSVMGGFDWDRDMGVIKEEGISLIITLMMPEELSEFGMGNIGSVASDNDIAWVQIPIVDGDIPSEKQEYSIRELINIIKHHVDAGLKVLIHCRGGLGRTGTIAGCYLTSCGVPLKETYAMLINARGTMCPENDLQRKYIKDFTERTYS